MVADERVPRGPRGPNAGPCIVHEYALQWRADLCLILGNVEHFEEATVPGCEARVGVEHADALRYVLERRAQQVVVEQNGLGRFRKNARACCRSGSALVAEPIAP